jgi:S1-C subfamily serine protease
MKRGHALGAVAALAVAGLVAGPVVMAQEKSKVESDGGGKKVQRHVVVRHAGSGGFLGVSLEDAKGDARGAVVRSVEPDSPAAKAGVKEGDVIVRFDGEGVRSAAQLARLVSETPSGRSVAIDVTRDGAPQKLTVTLDEGRRRTGLFGGPGGAHVFDFEVPEPPEPPEPPPASGARPHAAPLPPHAPAPPLPPHAPRAWSWNWDDGRGEDMLFHLVPGGRRKLGIQYIEMGEQLAAHYKLAQKNGVLVTSVEADSPAARAGLAAGDVVLRFDGKAIEDASDLREAVNAAEGGKEVTLSIQREGRAMDVKATLAKPEERRRQRSVKL